MRRFLTRLGAFLALQLVIATAVALAYRVDRTSYFAAVIDKHERVDATPAGRILFAGGSSVTFGIDSPRVSEALGRPVVNLSLHGALGLPYILAEAEAVVQPGDVVVLSAEYPHFQRDLTSDYLFHILEQRPASAAYLGWHHIPVLLDSMQGYVGNVVRHGFRALIGRSPEISDLPYARRGFNAEGDLVAHRDLPTTPDGGVSIGGPDWYPNLLEDVLQRLNAFHRAVQDRGGEVLLVFPVISERAFRLVGERLEIVHQALLRDGTIPMVDTPAQAVLPRDRFYDTGYHLNGTGVREHMDRLIPVLRERLK